MKKILFIAIVLLGAGAFYFYPQNKLTENFLLTLLKGQQEAISNAIAAGGDVNKVDEFGWTPLMYIASQGIDDRKEALDDKFPDLDLSFQKNAAEIAALLLNAGADVNALNKEGESPLLLAADSENLDLIKCLIKGGAKLNTPGPQNKSPLLIAIETESPAIAQSLIEAGADVNTTDPFGTTPLIAASSIEVHLETVEALIKAGADVNAVDDGGSTALTNSCFLWAETTATEMLIKAGANINYTNKEGSSVAFWAFSNREKNLGHLKALIRAGLKINSQNKEGDTALHMAIHTKELTFEIVKIFLQAGAKTNIISDDGDSVLMQALKSPLKEKSAIINSLIKAGAPLTQLDLYGQPPLQIAINYCSFEVIDSLIKAGADVNFTSEGGRTILMHAVLTDKTDSRTISALLKAGAKQEAVDQFDFTAKNYAKDKKKMAILELLK